MSILEQLPQGARVAIIRLRSLGDCVLTTPALSVLRTARPDLEIGVVVEDRFAAIFESPRERTAVLQASWRALRGWKPALCVNLHGGTRSRWMTALSGAKWRAGFAHHRTTFAYNFKIPRAQRVLGVERTVHTAEHLATAFFALGVPIGEVPRAELYARDSPIQGRYAVIHPFASASEKEWPLGRFCEVARYLRLWNITPIFLMPPGHDATRFREHQVFRGSLEEVKAVLSKAEVFIGNDSGPAHIAAAFGVPSVVLFSTSKPAIWGPWRTESQIVVAPDGMSEVNVSRVIGALERLSIFQGAHA